MLSNQQILDNENVFDFKAENEIHEEFEDSGEVGKFNPPEVFHSNIEYKRMLVQLIKVFKMKPSVAALALLATNFESCDAALNFASDDSSRHHDLSGPKQMRHPFIGCLALERIDLNDDI